MKMVSKKLRTQWKLNDKIDKESEKFCKTKSHKIFIWGIFGIALLVGLFQMILPIDDIPCIALIISFFIVVEMIYNNFINWYIRKKENNLLKKDEKFNWLSNKLLSIFLSFSLLGMITFGFRLIGYILEIGFKSWEELKNWLYNNGKTFLIISIIILVIIVWLFLNYQFQNYMINRKKEDEKKNKKFI